MPLKPPSFPVLASLLLTPLLVGCAGDEPPPAEETLAELNRFPYEQMAPEAPPPPRYEIPPPRPLPGDEYAWRPGHWDYVDGSGFAWRPGYWIKKPAFTAVWKPDFWTHHTYGWSRVPGHWE